MDEVAVRLAIRHFQPNIIISALAYTSVDKAESEPELAFTVNQRGVRYLAKAAESEGAALIHISTDYIFSGDKLDSYLETESIDPIEIYDESKFVVVEEIKQY